MLARPDVVDNLDYDVNGVRVDLQFTLRNTGLTPALGAFVNMEAFPSRPNNVPAERQRICSLRVDIGIDVFPNEEQPRPIGTTISRETVDEFWRRYQSFRPMIFPYIIACVIYGSPFEGETHHTPIAFSLVRRHSDVEGRAPIGIFVDEGRVPVSNLLLVRDILHSGRAD